MRIVTLVLSLLALVAAPAVAQRRAPLVLAAASLQEAMTAAAGAWAREGRPRPVLSFAASPALARQIEAGAPADLFASADLDWMDALDRKGLIARGTRANWLGNRLVVVAPVSVRGTIRMDGRVLSRVLGSGALAMGDPAGVPAGRYGRAALERLGAWPAVARRVVRAESVRAALALVERRAAPFGIVYATDARASRAVRIVGVFPTGSHPPIVYPLARLARSSNPEGEAFRRFLLSARGRTIFARHGFAVR